MTPQSIPQRNKETSRYARLFIALLGAIFMLLPATQVRAQLTVEPGWDLFTTVPDTTFAGVPFTGVPLTTFDFGVPIGVQNVWDTDTIVQRLAPAVVGGVPQTAAPIPIEVVALQLMSTVPVDFGLGVGTYFITLQSARGGPASVGQMTITFNNVNVPGPPQPQNGTFDSFFDVFFDVRLGALNGPIALSDNLLMSSSGNPWSHFPAPDALLIPGVNDILNGNNRLGDFHPITPFGDPIDEEHPTGAHHFVVISSVAPEPGSIGLVMLGIGLLGARLIRRRS